MASKRFIIFFLVLTVLVLALAYSLFNLKAPDTSSCDAQVNNIDEKIVCYSRLAGDKKDSRICNLIPKLIEESQNNDAQLEEYKLMAKESCKLQVIYSTNSSDMSQCEKFQIYAAACYYKTVIESEKPEYCPKAYGAEEPNNDGEVYECLAYIAIKKDDLSICTDLDSSLGTENIIQLCKNATGKDCLNEDIAMFKDYKSSECLNYYVSFSSSQGKLKPSVCEAMKLGEKDWCYTILASSLNDESYCNNIPVESGIRGGPFDDRTRDSCIMAIAIKKRDISLCSNLEIQDRLIEDYEIQNRCKKEVENAILSDQRLKQTSV